MDKRKKKAKVSKLHKRPRAPRAPGRRPRKPVSIPMSIDRVPNGIDLKSAKFAVDLLQAARERFEKDSESVWEALGHAADAMKEPIDEAEKWAEKLLDSFRWRAEATPDWEASTARAAETVRILERCKADEGPPVVDAETELMRRALAEALEHEPLSDGSEPSFKDLIVCDDGAPTYEQLIAALRKLARYAHRGPSTGMVRMPTPSVGNAVFNEALALVEQYEKAVSPLRTVTAEPDAKPAPEGKVASEIQSLVASIAHPEAGRIEKIEARVEAITRWLQQRFG